MLAIDSGLWRVHYRLLLELRFSPPIRNSHSRHYGIPTAPTRYIQSSIIQSHNAMSSGRRYRAYSPFAESPGRIAEPCDLSIRHSSQRNGGSNRDNSSVTHNFISCLPSRQRTVHRLSLLNRQRTSFLSLIRRHHAPRWARRRTSRPRLPCVQISETNNAETGSAQGALGGEGGPRRCRAAAGAAWELVVRVAWFGVPVVWVTITRWWGAGCCRSKFPDSSMEPFTPECTGPCSFATRCKGHE